MQKVNLNILRKPSAILSENNQLFYEENGILVVKNLISKSILEECRKRFSDICEKRVITNVMIVKEVLHFKSGKSGEHVTSKIQNIINDEVFLKYLENEQLLDAISYFTGPNIMNMHSMLINKPPKSVRHPPHQDAFYNPFEDGGAAVTTWTAIDDVDVENGCLFYIPGSHKSRHGCPHKVPSDKVNYGMLGVDEETFAPVSQRVDIILKAGDTVFIHPYVIHGSRPNNSNRFRKAILGSYISGSSRIVRETIGSQIFVDSANRINASKGLATVSHEDYFRNTSKLVRSVKSHI